MKHQSILKFVMPIILLAGYLLAFAGGGKPTEEDILNSTKPSVKPSCKEFYADKTSSLQLGTVNLKYDLSKYDDSILGDIMELQQAHYEMSFMSSDKKGTINYLSTILQNRDYYSTGNKPECKATFSGDDCTGTMSVEYYTADEVNGNLITKIPAMGAHLQTLKLDVKTIKSQMYNLQVVWTASINVTNIANIVVDKSGTVNCNWKGFTKIAPISGRIPVRIIEERGMEPILNFDNPELQMFDDSDTLNDSFVITIIEDPELISPELQKGVYSAGRINEYILWQEPVIVELS